jgi:eukaryotic-like serine/threonine-protein kinase
VMLTRSAEVKVMDFGIARAVSDAQATMTQTAQVIGTAQYLSPEQARGERVDARSDLYSTGCLLYELLTGRPPFTGDSPVAIAYQHVRENPVPPSQVDPEIPVWADSIVLKAMAKDPADRYQSAAEMRTDIQRALSGVPVAPPQATEMYSPGTQRIGPTAMMPGASPASAMSGYGAEGDGYDDGTGGGRRAVWWILGAVAAIIVVAVAYLLLSSGGGKTVGVPSVVSEPRAQAVQTVKKAGLTPKVVNVASPSVKPGIVISTDPQFGAKVAPGSVVTLRVSSGPKKISVPNVVGESQATAQQNLRDFRVVTRTDTNSTAPAGKVVRQSPQAGTMLAPGSQVTIYVSGGGAQVQNVVGDPKATAVSILQNQGFKVQVITVAGPASATPGNVFQQNPAAGSSLAAGSTVTIYVAAAATPTTPPPSSPASPTPSATPTPTATASGGSPSPGAGGHSP